MITPTEAVRVARNRVTMEHNGNHRYKLVLKTPKIKESIESEKLDYTTARTLLRQSRIAVALDLLGFPPSDVGATVYNDIGSWEDVVMSYYRRHRKDQNHANSSR